jgi:phage major head subunit gpT-like protein
MPALLSSGLRTVFFDRYDAFPQQYQSFFNVNTSDKAFEVTQGITDFGLVPEKMEGVGIQYDDPIQGYNQTYIHKTFGLGYRVTEEMMEDDRYKIAGPKMSKMLARACAVTREIQAWSVINNGFGDVGPDGVSLFNSAHPLERGGTYGNRPTTSVALSQTAIQNALVTMRRTVDGSGKQIRLKPKYLWCPPELEFYARELINSVLKPDSQNNNINAAAGSLDILVVDYLTSPTMWGLAAEKDQHSLQWFDRRNVRFKNSDDFDTGDIKYKSDYRSSVGYDDFRGVWASPGS